MLDKQSLLENCIVIALAKRGLGAQKSRCASYVLSLTSSLFETEVLCPDWSTGFAGLGVNAFTLGTEYVVAPNISTTMEKQELEKQEKQELKVDGTAETQ